MTLDKLCLHFNQSSPPARSCIVVALNNAIASCQQERILLKPTSASTLILESFGVSGQKIEASDEVITKHLCRVCRIGPSLFPEPSQTNASWEGVLESADVEVWLELATRERSGANDLSFLESVNRRLMLRTFLCGHSLSLADIFAFVSVGQQRRWELPAGLSVKFPHLYRWWAYINSLSTVRSTVDRFTAGTENGAPTAKQVAQGGGGGKKSPPQLKLANAVEGEVVTRFPPEPSGYLHIGHAKAALLNNYFARNYKGKLILRFDDTNPSKEKMEFKESILEDLQCLGIQPDVISNTSDHFPLLQDTMKRFILDGNAYVDKTPIDEMRLQRGEGIASACRENTIEQNIELWNQMLQGSEEGQQCCVRAKIDMKSKNKCMRDPVMYRCNVQTPHHITGYRFKAYPMYDFACPIVDSIEGVTHAMRTNEYADRIPQYEWVQKTAGVRPVIVTEFSRLNFVNTVLSKRKLQWIVDQKIVDSWEDPRFPTVRGILRRGLLVPALMEFLLEQGPSKNSNLMEWGALWSKNKQIIDPVVPRYMAVASENVVIVELEGAPPHPEAVQRQLHPKNPSVGNAPQLLYKEILIEQDDAAPRTEGEEVTLVRWGNVIFEKIDRDSEGIVRKIQGRLHLEGDFKSTEAKLHWVPRCASAVEGLDTELAVCVLREFDHLITKKRPEEEDRLEDITNRDSVFDTLALGDPLIKHLPVGALLQLERRGFFRVDQAFSKNASAVLIKIPDGRTKAMSTVSTKVDAAKLSRGQK